jgi:putative membrane protein
MTRILLAALHLLALGIGLGAVWVRARALARPLVPERLRAALVADAWWGVAALLWLTTGLWRLLASTEKATSYYLSNPIFHAKLGVFLLVFALEIWPMLTLTRWRRGAEPREGTARRISHISYLEAALVLVILVLATSMARGYGAS